MRAQSRPGLRVAAVAVLLALSWTLGPRVAEAVVQPAVRAAAGDPPQAQRVAATTGFYQSIEREVAEGEGLDFSAADATGQLDVLDYGLEALWAQGYDGAGTTVAIIGSASTTTAAPALEDYDRDVGLPPAVLREMPYPTAAAGGCQVDSVCTGSEAELDVEAVHTMAPYAHLLLIPTPVPESYGMQGWPEMAQAIEDVADKHLADVITISYGDVEANFAPDPENPGVSPAAAIHALDPAFLEAASQGIPVLFSSGDCGPTGAALLHSDGQCSPNLGRSAEHPADSPWVTAVGGSIPNPGLSTPGGRTAADALWPSSGAGVSGIYPRPSWQEALPALQGVAGRAYPDITLDSAVGTSQATPTLAGVLAIATQMKGSDLGSINPALYRLGPEGAAAGIVGLQPDESNSTYGITGYRTGPGYSIAGGWGTIWAPAFVPALVAAVDDQPALEAAADLGSLRGDLTLSTRALPAGSTLHVTGRHFIPGASPRGTTIRAGFGVYPPLRGQPGWVSGGPTASAHPSAEAARGRPWDTVRVVVTDYTGTVVHPRVTVGAPDLTGAVQVEVDTAGLQQGPYTVALRGDAQRQAATFAVRGTTPSPPPSKPWWDPF